MLYVITRVVLSIAFTPRGSKLGGLCVSECVCVCECECVCVCVPLCVCVCDREREREGKGCCHAHEIPLTTHGSKANGDS